MKTYSHISALSSYQKAAVINSTHTFKIMAILLLTVICMANNLSYAQTITAFTPASGPAGTSVVITGTGFNTTPSNNIVLFGATYATVNVASATSLTVIVPAGTNYQYITVTNLSTSLTAYSSKPFNITTTCSGTPGFNAPVNFQSGSHNVEVYDIDGDGKADLVTPDYFNNYLVVTRNTSTPGVISFAPKVIIPWASGGQPNEVSVGDFDGDGKADVALGGNGGGTFVSVYRNTSVPGSISFAQRLDFPASSGQGNGNRITDIDGDGKPDLLSVHWSGNCLWVLRNTSPAPGIISFAPGVSFSTTTQPHKIDVGDLDDDNKPDVVITAFTSNTMSIFRNTSVPGTISFAARQDYSPGTVPYYVHIGDIDGDNKPDIAVVNRDVATLAVYRNISTTGTITLAARLDFATPAGTMTHYGVAFGDLNGDGRPDIAVGNYTKNITSIFFNTSVPGTISLASRIDKPSGVSFDVGIDDFDGDSRPDIVVTNSGSTVSVLTNICTLIPLPVQLIYFNGKQEGNHVILKWATASEINNEYFEIEKSDNAIDFKKAGIVKGNGSNSPISNYSFADDFPFYGINYYRLKQVNYNGESIYSEVIAVNCASKNQPIRISPADDPGVYILHFAEKKSGIIKVSDISGRMLEQVIFENSGSELQLDLRKYSNGLFFVSVLNGNELQSFKVYKAR